MKLVEGARVIHSSCMEPDVVPVSVVVVVVVTVVVESTTVSSVWEWVTIGIPRKAHNARRREDFMAGPFRQVMG
jgi:hypothetical protein